MTDFPRLIEHAFPLKQASLDGVHEKNVRHGHISTLHIWPARRPLAACRAALIATLLPDPSAEPKPDGMSDEQWQKEIAKRRKELCEKIGGKVVQKIEKKKMPNGQTVERIKEETVGVILHWGRETENADTLEWFRQEIRKAYGGRAPKVLDPFAGGGAIPLEAMRLGCEATAVDINPVAWFILKCTLEYPQKLAGQTRPLPEFILHDDAFMAEFFAKAKGYGKTEVAAAIKRLHDRLKKKAKKQTNGEQGSLTFQPIAGSEDGELQADLAWHVRAWGQWVLDRARRELAQYYPTYADFEPIKKDHIAYEHQPMRLVPLKDDGTPDIDSLNAEFSEEYLADKRNPRWVAKPTVAYLWARTVTCKNCRATVPLLKTRWLCKKSNKRVLLTMTVKEVAQASVPVHSFSQYRRNLPHWRLEGSTYFLTWRLHKDQSPLLPQERSLVLDAIKHFNGDRYHLAAWVVMDDHVHVIVRPRPGHDLSAITHTWKSYTANRLQREHARRGPVWQDESWDRIIRNEDEFREKVEYILNNPRKRWPEQRDYSWAGFAHLHHTGTEACATRQVAFGIETDVPAKGGNAAQKREHDKRLGAGTMSRAGAACPCCGTIQTMEDIRLEGKAGRLSSLMTAVVVDTPDGKAYRLPTEHELAVATPTEEQVQAAFEDVPFGVPDEPTPSAEALGMRVPLYGFDKWRKLFTPRQLMALGRFVAATRAAREAMASAGYNTIWVEGTSCFLACLLDKLPGYNSMGCVWHISGEKAGNTFMRFALQITWDFMELPLSNDVGGAYGAHLDWVGRAVTHLLVSTSQSVPPGVRNHSATGIEGEFDAIVTDPPYYDAIPYSDLMDFFYIWLRRTIGGLSPAMDAWFRDALSPKWDHDANDGELIDDCSRHGNDAALSKKVYEGGMARVFSSCCTALKPEGRLVVVFANKQPDAWETLVSAIIRAGFVVDGSWPIQTEMSTRMRAKTSAALASSVWLAAKKRQSTSKPGWDNRVLEEMRANIAKQLREFWDAGIRGPDFVWAATGPALEAFSKHPVVRKANEPNATMSVGEFLNHVRRMVVDFVVGRVLSGEDAETRGRGDAAVGNLDEVTAYYLLHRHDFGMDEAPVGACILYATACGLSDAELERSWDILCRIGSDTATRGRGDAEIEEDIDDEDADADAETEEDGGGSGGGKVKLKAWNQRRGKSMGYEAPAGKAVPLIDRIHRVMHLWKQGDVQKVDEYLDEHGLRRNELFRRVVQSLIELSSNSERSLLESTSNHIGAKGAVKDRGPELFAAQQGSDRE